MEIISNPAVLVPIVIMLLLIAVQFIVIGSLKVDLKKVKEERDQIKVRYNGVLEREGGLEALIENGKLHTIKIENANSNYQNTISQLETQVDDLKQKIEKTQRENLQRLPSPQASEIDAEATKSAPRKRKAPKNPTL